MTYNWELFDRDPREWEIPNQGVTKIGRPGDPGDWEVLKWELESFVCEGEYADGLERILTTYLTRLSQAEQSAAWVSGFYGSGKSHLVRMLAALWADEPLPDGSTPRGLAKLSTGVSDALVELTTAGRKGGGLWAAAGKLSSGTRASYRLAFLSVLFESAGLPTQYPAARLSMTLRREGVYEDVIASLKGAGKDPEVEFLNLYVSTALAEAVIEALPDFAPDQMAARQLFKEQYPNVADITDADTITVMHELLELQSTNAEIPNTVIVLDELQQYIGDDNEKLGQVQNITELCATHFDSKVMLVVTGQSALAGSPILSKIKHRFPLLVELSDRDVENVTRTLVLRKKPQQRQTLEKALDAASGEINKHLNGTKIAARPIDKDDLVPDYPILPVRRRFWEAALRAIDRGGGTGQLRTQLRVTHDANRHVAEEEVPSAVGADFVYFNQISGMLAAKVLSQDLHETIQRYSDGTEEGDLKARVLALVFLISQLPTDEGSDLGVRARPEMLAELLVTDLRSGSGLLKPQVEKALSELEKDGVVVNVDGAFQLQTPEGVELQRKYQDQLGQIRNDAARISQERETELRALVEGALGTLRLTHGESKTSRPIELDFGYDAPDTSGPGVPVWVRNEWETPMGEVRAAAQNAAVTNPTVFVLLPKRDTDQLRTLIASHNAASEVLQTVPVPDTPEGWTARASLETQQKSSRHQLDQLLEEIVGAAKVWQAGGTEINEGSLLASVRKAAEASLARKFPKFKDADHARWHIVLDRAREGNADPLDQVGYAGKVADHPVCKAILQFLSTEKKGSEIRSHFKGGEYGWPDDAINGALLTLLNAGEVTATDKAGNETTANALRQSDIATTTFRRESTPPLEPGERIELRKMLAATGESASAGLELEAVSSLIGKLQDLASRAGADAPFPPTPDTSLLGELQQLSGNERLRVAYDRRDELQELYEEWKSRAAAIEERRVEWDRVRRLLDHADGLEVQQEVQSAMEALRSNRQLLENPNPLQPLEAKLVEALRSQLTEAHSQYEAAVTAAVQTVCALPEWSTIVESEGRDILARHGLVEVAKPAPGSAQELLASLDQQPLEAWRSRKDALAARIGSAQEDIARLAAPEATVVAVTLPKRVLKSEADVDEYLADVKQILLAKLSEDTHISV